MVPVGRHIIRSEIEGFARIGDFILRGGRGAIIIGGLLIRGVIFLFHTPFCEEIIEYVFNFVNLIQKYRTAKLNYRLRIRATMLFSEQMSTLEERSNLTNRQAGGDLSIYYIYSIFAMVYCK